VRSFDNEWGRPPSDPVPRTTRRVLRDHGGDRDPLASSLDHAEANSSWRRVPDHADRDPLASSLDCALSSTTPTDSYRLLLTPSANRVYAGQAPRLAAAELAITAGVEAQPVDIAGVPYLGFSVAALDLAAVARSSAAWALFRLADADSSRGEPPLADPSDPERPDAGSTDLASTGAGVAPEPLFRVALFPVRLPDVEQMDDDLVTIPKYPGKTNEQFTRLLLNVTLSQVTAQGPITVLDPLCGRGTTLTTAWLLGHDAAGVEADVQQVEALAAFLKTYLRRKRLKHKAEVNPVRREGRSLGRRLDVEARLPGDTRQSAALFGKKRFAAIVADAPYGVVHGSHEDAGDPRRRDRSAATLLRQAIPVWAGQLAPGGALGLSWNRLGLPRTELVAILAGAGLTPRDGGPWSELAHRVDSSIERDVVVAVAGQPDRPDPPQSTWAAAPHSSVTDRRPPTLARDGR